MNGLNYIRTRCNLSLNEVAAAIGVSRQAISAWESGKKSIPEKRLEQLSEFLGLDKKYFGEIGEKEKQYLLNKAMFRYMENGRETYRYKPEKDADPKKLRIFFLGDNTETVDEHHARALKWKKNILKHVEKNMLPRHPGLANEVAAIGHGGRLFEAINTLLDHEHELDPLHQSDYFYEIVSLLDAMMLAHGLKTEASLQEYCEQHPWSPEGKNLEHTLELAEMLKEHWHHTKKERDDGWEKLRNSSNRSPYPGYKTPTTIEEAIAQAEARHLEPELEW